MSETPGGSDRESRFERSGISRRQFVRLSAATAGALTLPGNAVADTTSPKFSDLYEYVVTHVPEDYSIPTLVELSDTAGFRELAANGFDPVTTTSPTIAAYVSVTPADVDAVTSVDSVTALRYSPGSNPFWLLDHYPDGVFPAPDDSVDFIDFEQMVDGMRYLEGRNDDRMRFYSVGESPGHYNLFLDEAGPQNLWVAELTNDVHDDAAFAEKQKVVFTLSIHGDERSGAEAGTRFVEQLLAGDEPEVEALLDDVVLVFLYPNPDGWVARNQQYRVDTDGDGEPEHNSFRRVTATGVDPNRQYPTVGWIDSEHNPAEPNGTDLVDDEQGVDGDVPPRYTDTVPDALDIVEFLRGYDNVRIGSDLHGMFWSSDFIEGLIVNDQYDTDEFHDLYEWNRRTEHRVENALADELDAHRDRFRELNETYGNEWGFDGSALPTPEEAYDYGTILDTIGYTTSGTLISWMSQPRDQGGLDIQMMAHEMGWDNRVLDRIPFRPWLVDLQVTGYQEVIRETAQHAVRTVTGTIETGGETTAYVDTDALTRTSAALSFTDARTRTTTHHVTVGPAPERVTLDVPDTTRSVSVSLTASGLILARLRTPTGRVVQRYNAAAADSSEGSVEWTVQTPRAGEWTIDVKTVGGSKEAAVTVRESLVLTDADDAVTAPDPVDVLGYQQRPYSVSPLEYFPDYAAAISGPDQRATNDGRRRNERGNGNVVDDVTGMTVDDVGDGALFRGRSERRAVDNLVVNHARGASSDAYTAELDRFVEAGGTLVLTDRGVSLLAALENDLVDAIGDDDVTEIERFSVFLSERVGDHPLLADTRPIQRELWKPAPLGYPISTPGTAPLTVVEPAAFTAAGGTVAGYTNETGGSGRYVSAGSFTAGDGEIHVVGGLLPPAHQSSLHPFGMLDYTATFLGHTVLTNALGHRQLRYVDGELVATYGNLE
ncbi:M14 family metallopeptidase [Halomicrococcus sp. SG-WS-1]|uniref:M14 family metallopeptidase n=1 Tax=Halomicrococcus sp. SG-WS-1 TaxID=3439057 RepID=UPI003F79A3F0